MKRILRLICVFALYGGLNAQSVQLELGGTFSKMPVTYSTVDGYIEKDFNDAYTGLSGALAFNVIEKKHFGVQIALGIQTAGGDRSNESVDAGGIFRDDLERIKAQYLYLGGYLLFCPINGKTRLALKLGPRLDMLLVNKDHQPDYIDDKDGYSRLNFGPSAGLELGRALGPIEIGIQGQYIGRLLDFIDLNAGDNPPFFFDIESRDQTMSAGLYVKIRI